MKPLHLFLFVVICLLNAITLDLCWRQKATIESKPTIEESPHTSPTSDNTGIIQMHGDRYDMTVSDSYHYLAISNTWKHWGIESRLIESNNLRMVEWWYTPAASELLEVFNSQLAPAITISNRAHDPAVVAYVTGTIVASNATGVTICNDAELHLRRDGVETVSPLWGIINPPGGRKYPYNFVKPAEVQAIYTNRSDWFWRRDGETTPSGSTLSK